MEIFYLILKLDTLIFHFHKCPCSTGMLDYGHDSNATFRVLFNMIKSHGLSFRFLWVFVVSSQI